MEVHCGFTRNKQKVITYLVIEVCFWEKIEFCIQKICHNRTIPNGNALDSKDPKNGFRGVWLPIARGSENQPIVLTICPSEFQAPLGNGQQGLVAFRLRFAERNFK